MRGNEYTVEELQKIVALPRPQLIVMIRGKNLREAMAFRQLLQRSITYHGKELNLEFQMQIVVVTMTVERYCRPHIYADWRKKMFEKHPSYSDQKLNSLAKDLTAKTIKKLSY